MRRVHLVLSLLVAVPLLAAVPIVMPLRADDASTAPKSTQVAPPSQEQILEEILDDKAPPPSKSVRNPNKKEKVPGVSVDLAKLLQAPAAKLGPLVREGTLISRRRARLVHVGKANEIPVLIFQSETKDAPERPMIVMPTRKLEELEEFQAQYGQDANVVVSGQVEKYRGNNYLLMTQFKGWGTDKNVD